MSRRRRRRRRRLRKSPRNELGDSFRPDRIVFRCVRCFIWF
jgi:hypothetical protein